MGKNSHANPHVVVSVRCVIDLKYWVKCQSIALSEHLSRIPREGSGKRLLCWEYKGDCLEGVVSIGVGNTASHCMGPDPDLVLPTPQAGQCLPTYRKRNRGAEKLTTLPRWHSKVPGPGVGEKMGRKGIIGRAKSCGGLNVRLGVWWADDIDMNLVSYLLQFVEDVGDEGEEEKEFISYNINIDIHYGVKSNR